jgi:outer membrane protein TolC
MLKYMKVSVRQISFLLFSLVILQRGPANAQSTNAQSTAPHSGLSLLDAVESTLQEHPLIRSQQAQVQISRGFREQASSVFDSVITSGLSANRSNLPLTSLQQQQNTASGVIDTADQISNTAAYTVGMQRLFRNGISVTPQLQLGRTTDNLFSTGGINTSTLGFAVNIPLMQGRGKSVVAAQETAAKEEVDATLLDLNFLISQLMTNTASSYWNLVAAEKNLAIATDAEERGKVYLDQVSTLVNADHVPRNDLHEVQANLAQRSATRVAAEQQVFAAQQQLALDMGVSAERIVLSTPVPSDDFPIAEEQKLPSDIGPCMEYYSEEALQRRGDYLASQRRYAGTRVLLNAARNRMLPQVNLNLYSGYTGMQEGRQVTDFFSSSFTRVPGPNAAAGITYTFPSGNRAARGEVLRSEGAVTQAEVQRLQLARGINSSVVVSLEGVRNAILRAQRAREAVDSFRSALTGEREKYAGGIGSIVNILSVEDKLTAALSEQVQSELAYVTALAQFRLATGTLVQPNQAVQNVPADTFVALPFTCTSQEVR